MHLLSVFSLRNRALIALLTIVIAGFGAYALTSLKQDLFPSINLPQLVVITSYPGASPDVVETDVSTPIETAIQGVAGLDSTSATSTSGVSSVSASFVYGTNIATAEQKVQLAINRIASRLPSAVDPQVVTGSLDDIPVIRIAVTSDLSSDDLSSRLEASTIGDIQQLDGVREAALLGTTGQRVTITPDLDTLSTDGYTTQSIRDAIKNNGTLLASGSITENDSTLTVQSGTRLISADDIAALPLTGGSAQPTVDLETGTITQPPVVTIGEIAEVAVVDNTITSVSRTNGEPSLTISITKTPDGNTVDVSKSVLAAIPDLEAAVGDNTKFTVVFNQAPYIQQSIESLAQEGLLGLAFAVVVILIFLLSVRSTIVTAISIPVSVLITFLGMLATGYSLNVITLGALTIAIGRVVDDSIVVIENIKRHLGLGETKLDAIKTGVREVATAVTASTITTVAVFLPLGLVSDVTGELFRPFALTVTMALLASLFVALTIVPVLAYWFLKSPSPEKIAELQAAHREGEDELDKPTLLQRIYIPVIRWSLRFPAIVIVAALVVLGGSGYLATQLKTNFIGSSGQNTLTVTQDLPAGTSLEATDTAAKIVEAKLEKIDGVDIVQLSLGSSGTSLASLFGGSAGVTYSVTTDPDADQDVIQEDVRSMIKGLDADQVGDVALSTGGGFGSSDIAIQIKAPDADSLDAAANDIVTAVQGLTAVAQAESDLAVTQPFIDIEVDRQKAAAAGLSEIAVGGIVTEAMLPASIGSVVIDAKTLQIYVTNPKAPVTIQELRDFQIPTNQGLVALSTLATVEQVDGPSSITTIRGVRSATVTVTPSSDDTGTASAQVQQAVDKVDLPDGATAELGGVTSQQNDAFSQLFLALLAAILIVYTVMVATFRSLRQPLLLLVSVPFAATGAILLQLASGVPLGVASIIGLLMLVGIVVTNAIVLIDLVNQYRARGLTVKDAVEHGAARRLRPILMTALATIGALVPMAIGITGHGGFISQPLAIIVIGGLISSTVLTLIVLPSLYSVVEGASERRADRRAAKELAGGRPPQQPREPRAPREDRSPRMSTADRRDAAAKAKLGGSTAVLDAPATTLVMDAAPPPALPSPFEGPAPVRTTVVPPPPAPVSPAPVPPAPVSSTLLAPASTPVALPPVTASPAPAFAAPVPPSPVPPSPAPAAPTVQAPLPPARPQPGQLQPAPPQLPTVQSPLAPLPPAPPVAPPTSQPNPVPPPPLHPAPPASAPLQPAPVAPTQLPLAPATPAPLPPAPLPPAPLPQAPLPPAPLPPARMAPPAGAQPLAPPVTLPSTLPPPAPLPSSTPVPPSPAPPAQAPLPAPGPWAPPAPDAEGPRH
ncbi:efflux RND transporter permease subunit [soil metagenome]